jgi:hypothetical protein
MFLRTCSRPRRDLDRGFSYEMGCFGDAERAHEGLSGYSLDRGTEDAVEALASRMGVAGRFERRGAHRRVAGDAVMFVAVFEGRDVGTGPDQEELFRPSRIVATFKTRELAGAADLVTRLAALGLD